MPFARNTAEIASRDERMSDSFQGTAIDDRAGTVVAHDHPARAQVFEVCERFRDGELLMGRAQLGERALASRPGNDTRDLGRVAVTSTEGGGDLAFAMQLVRTQF